MFKHNSNNELLTYMFILFCVITMLWPIQSRIFQTSMKGSLIGSSASWVYLDKMSFAPGTVEIQVTSAYRGLAYGGPGYVTVQAIPEWRWQQEKQRKCRDVSHEPFLKHKLTLQASTQDFTRDDFQLDQTTLYYFVLKDCLREIRSEYTNSNIEIRIKLHLLNNGSELGQQQDHWYILPIIFICGIWLVYFYNDKLKGSNFNTEYHKMIMFAGIVTQISSLTWKTIGFLIYHQTGADYSLFHFIYLFMHSMSQSMVISLIILIGFGWTINFNAKNDMDLYLPIIGCLAFLNALLTILTKLQSGQHDRHHIFDNISGHVIVGYRVLLVVVFIVAVIYTYKISNSKVKNFIKVFAVFGALYISALPLIILIGNRYVEPKDRHEFIFVSMEGLKCFSNVCLSIMINRSKSQYNAVSYENRSFVPQDSKYF